MCIQGTSGEEDNSRPTKYNDAATIRKRSSAGGPEASDFGLQRQEEKSAKLQRDRANHSDNEQRNR